MHSSRGQADTSLAVEGRRHLLLFSNFRGIGTDKSKNGSKQNDLKKKKKIEEGIGKIQ